MLVGTGIVAGRDSRPEYGAPACLLVRRGLPLRRTRRKVEVAGLRWAAATLRPVEQSSRRAQSALFSPFVDNSATGTEGVNMERCGRRKEIGKGSGTETNALKVVRKGQEFG